MKVGQNTLNRYLRCIQIFKQWAKQQRRPTSGSSLDSTVNRYITFLHYDGAELAEATYLVYGLQLLECNVSKEQFLVTSKSSLAGWRKLSPGTMRMPVPEEFLFDAGVLAIEEDRLDIAVAIALQLDGYLRPSECLGLDTSQVSAPQGRRYPHWAIVIAPAEKDQTTKTGKSDDSVLLGDRQHNQWVGSMMKLWLSSLQEGPLFPGLTLSAYERWFREANKTLKYTGDILKPHVIRHSGPSNDVYHQRRLLQEVQKRGRWEARASVVRYEKHATLLAQWKRCDPKRKNTVLGRSQHFKNLLLSKLRNGR